MGGKIVREHTEMMENRGIVSGLKVVAACVGGGSKEMCDMSDQSLSIRVQDLVHQLACHT